MRLPSRRSGSPRTAGAGRRPAYLQAAHRVADGREFELDRVRLDQRFQRRGLRVAGGSVGHRDPPSSWS